MRPAKGRMDRMGRQLWRWARTHSVTEVPPTPVGAVNDQNEVVSLDHVTKRLGDRLAMDDISLTVRRGELFALIGPSGSGKTTAVRVICGIYRPDAGTVRLLGWDRLPWPRALRDRFGYMPQAYSLYPRMTAGENLRYAAALYGMDSATTRRRAGEVLELVDLTDQRGRLAGEISGGQRRRLALAVALMHDPELLFVDEPTAGLDPALRARLWTYFRQLSRSGRTVVVTTQYIDEAELTDRVAIMRAARMIALDTPVDLARAAFGGEIVELRSSDLTAQAARALGQIDGVRDVAFADLDTLQVVVDVAEAAAPRLLAALVRWGCTVQSIGIRRPRFEDVFLRLTGVAPQPESTAGADQREADAPVRTYAMRPDAASDTSGETQRMGTGKDSVDG